MEASEEAAFASELEEDDQLINQIDGISSPKPRRWRPHQRQGSFCKREHLQGKWMLFIVFQLLCFSVQNNINKLN